MDRNKLLIILENHKKWRNVESTGIRADLHNADLSHADLSHADLDFTSWPLWCGSTKVKIDDRISKQLAYHAICIMSDYQRAEFLKDPIAWANEFHRVGEVDKL